MNTNTISSGYERGCCKKRRQSTHFRIMPAPITCHDVARPVRTRQRERTSEERSGTHAFTASSGMVWRTTCTIKPSAAFNYVQDSLQTRTFLSVCDSFNRPSVCEWLCPPYVVLRQQVSAQKLPDGFFFFHFSY